VSNPSTYPARFVALRTPSHKYVRELGSGAEQTYLLADDPSESSDVTDARPGLAAALRADWQKLREAAGAAERIGRGEELAPTEQERLQLEHLGYVEP
jgi:hypothetical protein